MTERYLGSTMSGQPGSSLACNRYRNPSENRAFRRVSSGRVSRPPILAIRADRASGVRKSATYNLSASSFLVELVANLGAANAGGTAPGNAHKTRNHLTANAICLTFFVKVGLWRLILAKLQSCRLIFRIFCRVCSAFCQEESF